jgi:hypothetical protein
MERPKTVMLLIVFSSLLFFGCSSPGTNLHPLLNITVDNSVKPVANATAISGNSTALRPIQNTTNSSLNKTTPALVQNQTLPELNQTPHETIPPSKAPSAILETHERYLLLLPDHPNLQSDSIIIVAFSPSGDANSMISAWQAAAEKRGWPVFASRTFHNGELPAGFDSGLISDIGNVSLKLGYAQPKYVFTGFSGGGQYSHAFAWGNPKTVAAVVSNCGIINRGFLNFSEYYPRNKTVLFIASPTDFRYAEMKQDNEFLTSKGWKTGWIEFIGGHALAPSSTYEQAAEWLAQEFGNGAK